MPMPGPAEVGSLVAGETTGNVVDLDQPIDFALVLRGHTPRGAMSAAVRSLEEAKSAFSKYTLVPVQNGALRIDGLGKPDDASKDGDEGEARVCELVPSVSGVDRPAPQGAAAPSRAAITRLICAESEKTLDELAPWLARTAPRSTYPADAHVEVRMSPIRAIVTQMRRLLPMLAGSALGIRHTGVPEVDDSFRALIDDLADFSSDADTIAVDAMFGEPQGTVTITSQFRSSTSLLARLAVSHPERAAAPPAAFWKLPGDSDVAFFHGAIDPADFEHLRDHVADVVGAALAKNGLNDADRKAVRDVASHTLESRRAPLRVRQGDRSGRRREGNPGDQGRQGGGLRGARRSRARGGGEDGGLARDGARRAGGEGRGDRKGVGCGVGATWDGQVGALEGDGHAAAPMRMAPLPKGIAGKGAAHLELVVYPERPASADADADEKKKAKKPPAGKPLILHAIVVPDGTASWLVLAADEALAVSKANEVLGSGSLASRPGLASIKDGRVNAGGFVTSRSFEVEDVFAWVLAPRWWKLEHDPLGKIVSSPDQGATPMLFQFASQPGAGASAAGTFTATATVPKVAIESLVRMAMH